MAKDRADGGVRSVQLALDVLEVVAFSGDELGVTQLADRLSVTKASVHRHPLTLVERGYRVQNSVTARYAIGSKRRLLARFAPDNDLVQLAEGPMRELRDCLGHSVVVSAMTLRGVLVLNTVAGAAATEIGVRPGSELPFHASAQGKILLVQCAASAAGARAGASTAGFHSPQLVDPGTIREELSRVARLGFACAPEEAMLGSMPWQRRFSTTKTRASAPLPWLDRSSSCQRSRVPPAFRP
jgi:DNA-binding IclR family transcriptional regulator